MSQLFTSDGQSIRASTSASVLPVSIQGWFPLGLTGLISLLSKDSQESSPTPQFKSINSLACSLLYSPTLPSILDYWKNRNFDYMDLCRQSKCLCFLIHYLGLSQLFFQGTSFNFMTAVTICSDFWASKSKICHCFHIFPIYLPWNDGTRYYVYKNVLLRKDHRLHRLPQKSMAQKCLRLPALTCALLKVMG